MDQQQNQINIQYPYLDRDIPYWIFVEIISMFFGGMIICNNDKFGNNDRLLQVLADTCDQEDS